MLEGKKILFVNMWPNKYFDIYARHFGQKNTWACMVPRTEEELRNAADQADIVWSIFCNDPAIVLSQNPAKAKLVTSLRVYEMMPEVGFVKRVNWDNVSLLLYESSHIRDLTDAMYADALGSVRRNLVWDCVWMDDYPFYDSGNGYNLAYIGYINSKKGWDMVLQCLYDAVSIDKRYKLHVAGTFQEPRWEMYIRHAIHYLGLENHIQFDGWVSDIRPWLADKNYLLSCSQWEGCPKGIIEAMACGVKPLIHNFVGAYDVFPKDLIYTSLGDFQSLLRGDYDADAYRSYVEYKFSAAKNMPLMDQFIAEAVA